jgi:hypothetical protein
MSYFPQPDRFRVISRSVSDEGSPLMEEGYALLQLLSKLIFAVRREIRRRSFASLRTTRKRAKIPHKMRSG